MIDIITNSSSELFVLQDKSSVEVVKEVVTQLIAIHNKKEGTDYTFEDCFKEPEIAEYGFDFWKVPEKLRGKYEAIVNKEFKINYYPKMPYTKSFGPSYSYTSNYNTTQKLIAKGLSREAIDWRLAKKRYNKLKLELEIFCEFLKQNELLHLVDFVVAEGTKQIKGHYLAKNKYPRLGFDEETLSKPWEFFSLLTDWDIECRKGNIILNTQEDNSAPYEIFGAINSFFYGENYHLG